MIMPPNQQVRLQRLLRDNPRLAILVAELLGPPLGLRAQCGPGESDKGS